MIREENLNKLYNGLIEGKELTTKTLNGYGFTSKDLSDLIENGTLERIKRGYYSFHSVDALFYYGKKLIAEKENEKATRCFEKCFEVDANHYGACFQLFLRSIQSKNYEKAFIYFEHFYNSENEFYNADSNFYLYLLSMITELPEHHRNYAKFLKFGDFKVDFQDKRYENNALHNKIRLSASHQKFSIALKQLNEVTKEQGKFYVQDIVTKILLEQAMEVQINNRYKILDLLKKQNYEEIIAFLEDLETHHFLSISDAYTLQLTKDLVDLQRTKMVPEKSVFSTTDVFKAINGKNYELALEISMARNQNINASADKNTIHLLLQEINNQINKLTNRKTEEPINEIPKQEVEIPKPKANISPVQAPIFKNATATFTDVIRFLTNNDLENAFRTLRNYLESIHKKQYEFLIINLIKISLLDGDIAFTKPMLALTYVSRDNFEFNLSEYIQNFYVSLSQNHFDQTRVYLDIIAKANRLGTECVLTDGLEQVLNTTEKSMNYQSNNRVLDRVEQSLLIAENTPIVREQQLVEPPKPTQDFSLQESIEVEEPVIEEEVEVVETHTKVNKRKVQEPNKDYDDREFIEQKLENVYAKGMVLLKPMDKDRRKGIYEIVKSIPDVVAFSIGEGQSKRVVLRYQKESTAVLNFKQILKTGNEAYYEKDYNTCIQSYRTLLETKNPKAFVYAKLGLAYMKKFDKETAIDYLTVATELSKLEDKQFDFTELIASLNGLIPREDKKPRVKMPSSDFDDIDEYYGIDYIDEMADMVLSGTPIEEVFEHFQLNDEQKCTVLLIFARECFIQGNFHLGDQYLKMVEKSKKPSKFVNSLYEEVKRNKQFYQFRVGENYVPLILVNRKSNYRNE